MCAYPLTLEGRSPNLPSSLFCGSHASFPPTIVRRGWVRYYIGFDDTDILDADRGTGKLARWFVDCLPEGMHPLGVLRQQLLVDPLIPYTSHNSAACVVAESPDPEALPGLVVRATAHLAAHFLEGSDPGLCVASEEADWTALEAFGLRATREVLAQEDARRIAGGVHLSAHGGSGDGIIGALAAVGLTHRGWSGRYVEYRGLRQIPREVAVGDLRERGIRVVALDRDATVPRDEDLVCHDGWLRPRLLGGGPVLPVTPEGTGVWRFADPRRREGESAPEGRDPSLH